MDVAGIALIVAFTVLLPVGLVGALLWRFRQPPVAKMRHPVAGEAHVVSCSGPGESASYTNYSMTAVVRGDGVPPTSVRHKGIAPTAKWPYPGTVLPVTVDRADPSVFRIEWDRVPTGRESGAAEADRLAEAMRAGTAGPAGPGIPPPAGSTFTSSVFDLGSTLVVNGQQVDPGRFPGLHEQIARLVGGGQGNPEETKAAIRDLLKASGVTMPGAGAAAPDPAGPGGFTTGSAATGATGFNTGAVPTDPTGPGGFASGSDPTGSVTREPSADPVDRLRRLDGLRRQGLISEAEYQTLRRDILADL